LARIARRLGTQVRRGRRPWREQDFKQGIQTAAKEFALQFHFLRGASWITRFMLRHVKASRTMHHAPRKNHESDAILFVSYFPAFDKEKAKNGIFRNRYALPLQKMLTEKGRPVHWLLMCVPYENLTYQESL